MPCDSWNRHEELLLAFEKSWSAAEPAKLADFLETVATSQAEGIDLRYLTLELAKIDLEHQLKDAESSVRCEAYLELPKLRHDDDARLELLAHEVAIREELGSPATESELQQRFPAYASELKTLAKRSSIPLAISGPLPLPQPGEMLKQYQLKEIVGSGSFAVVFRAHDTKLARQVAIKLLRHGSEDSDAQTRMRREALATASLNHKNVVPIIEVDTADGHDYIVSHFVDGPTLQEAITCDTMSTDTAVEIAAALADGLSEAHANGIVHRDMKPANILMEDGEPRITDFGLAQLGEASIHLTHEGDVLGTPAYMPPEQASGNAWQADPRSDIYSVGVILYEMTVGKLPFEGHAASVIQQVIHKEPPPPRRVRPTLPFDLQTIILKCLEKEPVDRYQTAGQFASDLRAFRGGRSISARPTGMASRVWKWSRRRPALAVTLVVSMFLLSLALGIGLQYGRTRELLAQSSASAGTLAMQRGQAERALSYFDQAIAEGHDTPNQLRLRKLDALVSLGRFDDARAELRTIKESADSSQVFPGELLVWQAEMGLAQRDDLAESLFEQALAAGLDSADHAYARAVLSHTSPAAVDLLRQAIMQNPFHHRARRMLGLVLLSLARFDEAGESIRMGISLYPEDDDFQLIYALWHASQDDLQASHEAITRTRIDADERHEWSSFCSAIHFLNQQISPYEADPEQWVDLANDFENQYVPLMRSRFWCFPPRIAERFAELPDLLRQMPRERIVLGKPLASHDHVLALSSKLEDLVSAHPEATLFQMLGTTQMMLNYVASPNEAGWAELNLESALDAFLGSREYPGFVAARDQHMYDGLLSASLMLWLGGRDIERSRAIFVEAAKMIDDRYIESKTEARAMAIGAMRSEVDELKYRWCRHYVEQFPDELDAMWTAAIMYRDRGNLSEALRLAHQLETWDPENEEYSKLKAAIVKQLEEKLEESKAAVSPPTSQ